MNATRRPNEVIQHELSLKQFSFNKDRRSLVAEASDFGRFRLNSDVRLAGYPWFVGQLWNDACDIGICVLSEFTGKRELFYYDRCDENRDGEVAGWYFKPVNKLANVDYVLIIND